MAQYRNTNLHSAIKLQPFGKINRNQQESQNLNLNSANNNQSNNNNINSLKSLSQQQVTPLAAEFSIPENLIEQSVIEETYITKTNVTTSDSITDNSYFTTPIVKNISSSTEISLLSDIFTSNGESKQDNESKSNNISVEQDKVVISDNESKQNNVATQTLTSENINNNITTRTFINEITPLLLPDRIIIFVPHMLSYTPSSEDSDDGYSGKLYFGIDSDIDGYNMNDMTDENCYKFMGLFQIGHISNQDSSTKTSFLELVSLSEVPSNNEGTSDNKELSLLFEGIKKDIKIAFPISDEYDSNKGGYPIKLKSNKDFKRNSLEPESYLLISKNKNLDFDTNISTKEPDFNSVKAFRIIVHFKTDKAVITRAITWKDRTLGGNGNSPRINIPPNWYLEGGIIDAFIHPINIRSVNVTFTTLIALSSNNGKLNIYTQNIYPDTKFSLATSIDLKLQNGNEPIFLSNLDLNFNFVSQTKNPNYVNKSFTLNCTSANSDRRNSLFTKSLNNSLITNLYLYLNIKDKYPQLIDGSRSVAIKNNSSWITTLLYNNAKIDNTGIINIPKNNTVINSSVLGNMSNFYITTQNINLIDSSIQVIQLSTTISIPEL